MADKKDPASRSVKFPARLMVYGTDEDLEFLQKIADFEDRSQASVIRRLIRQRAAELGFTAGREDE